MTFRLLKKFRVFISLVFFCLITFLFIDFKNLVSPSVSDGILFFQFVPSILKFINVASIAAIGFLLVLILTFFFGRVYCSFLCPLGVLQDIIHFFTKRFKKRKVYKFAKAKNLLRYSLLILVIAFLLFGSIFFLNLLDPYSMFGKIASNLLRPIYYLGNNIAAGIVESMGSYALFPVKMKSYSWLSIAYSISILSLIIWMTYKYGRLYCNTLCPVGAFLGFISKYSIFKISLNESLCNSCGACGSKCKAQCIDTKNKKVDFTRCVGCMNCLTACPSSGVVFSRKSKQETEPLPIKPINERRNFIKSSALVPLGIVGLAKHGMAEEIKEGMIPVVKEYHVIPPGALSIKHFTNQCTACHLCVSACPTKVIQPSFLEFGLSNMMQPYMDFHTNFCNFECVICSEVCPTGAILPIQLEEKKLTQLGISKFIKENCVVYTDETACGACSEHCPTKAVDMVYYKDKLNIPEVNEDICIGCGACEYACPTTPKSIYVDGNPIHVLAEKPVEEKIETQVSPEDDFPF